jgi:hypothetical protein
MIHIAKDFYDSKLPHRRRPLDMCIKSISEF